MKKILCLIMALGFAVLSVGCGVEIADSNGADDYTLAEITDQNIIDQDLGCSSYSQKPGSEENEDLSETTRFKSKNFSGVSRIFLANYIGKSDVTIDVSNLTVDSGNFRLVVILDDEIIHEFTKDELMETYELRDIKGTVEIVMAGESAEFKFWISVW